MSRTGRQSGSRGARRSRCDLLGGAASAQPPGGPPGAAHANDAEGRGADRPHGLVGIRGHRGLALAHGHAAQGRLREHSRDAGRARARRGLGSCEGRSGRRALQGVRRARHPASAGSLAHHVGGRRDAQDRDRRGHADAAAAFRRRGSAARPSSRACRAGRRRAGRGRCGASRLRSRSRSAPSRAPAHKAARSRS